MKADIKVQLSMKQFYTNAEIVYIKFRKTQIAQF